jgi:uncharacterized protein YndB with AHSA1/START domain
MSEAAVAAREIAITRIYDAPRELVWAAWTDPDQLASWWGKRGWTARRDSVVVDPRPGGLFTVTTVSAEDGAEMTNAYRFSEVVEPQRLVLGDDGSRATVTFTDLGDRRTEMRFHSVIHATEAICDAAKGGLSSAFERLGEQLHLLQTATKED